mmetsp:Transcript_13102/g.13152  ORF Transcript_13102/g.13152 Transcript_13102/m.13152 type:complete len:106 (+) Transcript_13102:42-359(+)
MIKHAISLYEFITLSYKDYTDLLDIILLSLYYSFLMKQMYSLKVYNFLTFLCTQCIFILLRTYSVFPYSSSSSISSASCASCNNFVDTFLKVSCILFNSAPCNLP